MTLGLDVRVRVLAPVLLLGAAGLALGLFMLTRPSGSEASEPTPVARSSAAGDSAPPKSRKQDSTLEGMAPVAPAPRRAAPSRPPAQAARTDSALPARVAKALRRDQVVVVSFVSPEAALDDVSLQEARAGAKRSGAGFVALSMLEQPDAKALAAKLGVRHTPAVLVFTRPGRVFVQFDGFADRETVAQAATNAAP